MCGGAPQVRRQLHDPAAALAGAVDRRFDQPLLDALASEIGAHPDGSASAPARTWHVAEATLLSLPTCMSQNSALQLRG
jgi:hypothetical protein